MILQLVLSFQTQTFSQSLVPDIFPIVDDRIDHGVGHGKPVEEEIDVLYEGFVDDGVVMVGVDEVHVIRQPANAEDGNDDHEHFYHLNKS